MSLTQTNQWLWSSVLVGWKHWDTLTLLTCHMNQVGDSVFHCVMSGWLMRSLLWADSRAECTVCMYVCIYRVITIDNIVIAISEDSDLKMGIKNIILNQFWMLGLPQSWIVIKQVYRNDVHDLSSWPKVVDADSFRSQQIKQIRRHFVQCGLIKKNVPIFHS